MQKSKWLFEIRAKTMLKKNTMGTLVLADVKTNGADRRPEANSCIYESSVIKEHVLHICGKLKTSWKPKPENL